MPKSTDNTVFVRFVPTPKHTVMRHELEELFSQIGPIKKSSWISGNKGVVEGSGSSKGYGFVKYLAQEDAEDATTQLNNTKIEMQGQMYQLKVELASLTLQPKSKKKDVAEKANENKEPEPAQRTADPDSVILHKKKSRIILRNLSFYAKETHIRKAMESNFGPVLDVHVPRVKSNLHVGFCFVTFEKPADAQKAVKASTIDIQKRTTRMEWSLPKKLHQQQQQEERERKERLEKRDNNLATEDEEGKEKDLDDDLENDEKDGEDSDADDENEARNSSSEESDSESQPGSEMKVGDEGSEGDEEIEEEDDVEVQDDSVQKKQTLFLRNLPFDASRHDLFEAFYKFGRIKGIYLVKDKETGVLKGTAFVTFESPESASKAINQLSTARSASFISPKESQNLPDSGPNASVNIRGRTVLVDLAVDKETASTFDSKAHKAMSADRRNMYLMSESRVPSSSDDPNADNTDTFDDLPQQDQRKRQTALTDKTTKLKSPLFFINPHRLSFRNLAKNVDEGTLQRLCATAIPRALARGAVTAEDVLAHWRAKGDMTPRDILNRVQKMEARGEPVLPPWDESIKNVKELIPSVYIDRDTSVGNGKKSTSPSRGFGFAEFTHHVHALACLRELNNNSAYSVEFVAGGAIANAQKKKKSKQKVGGAKPQGNSDYTGADGRVRIPRLIVDFAVENKLKAKKQAEHRAQQQANHIKQRLERKSKAADDADQKSEEASKKKKSSRGAIQREKKRKNREEKEAEGDITAETLAKNRAAALAEAKQRRKELAKQRKEEQAKAAIKPPKKKKKKMDQDDTKFEEIVDTYRSTFTDDAGAAVAKKQNARKAVREKRWFE